MVYQTCMWVYSMNCIKLALLVRKMSMPNPLILGIFIPIAGICFMNTCLSHPFSHLAQLVREASFLAQLLFCFSIYITYANYEMMG